VGAELARSADKAKIPRIGAPQIATLEQAIDRYESGLPPLTQFILPSGTRRAATLHVARSVCRRAERQVVRLGHSEESAARPLLVYLNRLSDLLFVLARAVNQAEGQADEAWRKPTS
jgi:cob(I)alamin adenosyltransferase